MSRRRFRFLSLMLFLFLATGCASTSHRVRSSALEFLYPKGSPGVSPADVRLTLPVRVGVAFAPDTSLGQQAFTETQKQALLSRIAAAFQGQEGIKSVEVIPSSHLVSQGGFDNLYQLSTAFGIDLIALISYDQVQFRDSGASSWAYLTIVGAYFVRGEKNETRTVLDAVVYDIASRAMLFHATGINEEKASSTPIEATRAMRKLSEKDFDEATDSLIANLGTALGQFREQAKTGTVRGPGTPAITLASTGKLTPAPGQQGAGALGAAEMALLAVLGSAAAGVFRRRGR